MLSITVAVTVVLSLTAQVAAAPIGWNRGSTIASHSEKSLPAARRSSDPAAPEFFGLKRPDTNLQSGSDEPSSADSSNFSQWIVELVQRSNFDLSGLKRAVTGAFNIKVESTDSDLDQESEAMTLSPLKRSTSDLSGLKRSTFDLSGLKRSTFDLSGLKRYTSDLSGLRRSTSDLSGLKRSSSHPGQ